MAEDPGGLGPGAPDELALIDACTWRNFAVVDAIWVLESHFGHTATWTEATRHELRLGAHDEPELRRVLDLENGWLGEPLRLDQDGDEVVDVIRRGLGGARSAPLQYLSAAEAIRALERADVRRRRLITDNSVAADFAGRRTSGICTMGTAEVLAEAHKMGQLACAEAHELLKRVSECSSAVHAVRLLAHDEFS